MGPTNPEMTAPSIAKLLRRFWLDSFEGLATAEYKLKRLLDPPRFYGYINACSGGNSRLSHLSGVGGGKFFDQEIILGRTAHVLAPLLLSASVPSLQAQN